MKCEEYHVCMICRCTFYEWEMDDGCCPFCGSDNLMLNVRDKTVDFVSEE